jgi:ABC-type microcin C transport system duplicated ATPase subunit YejF
MTHLTPPSTMTSAIARSSMNPAGTVKFTASAEPSGLVRLPSAPALSPAVSRSCLTLAYTLGIFPTSGGYSTSEVGWSVAFIRNAFQHSEVAALVGQSGSGKSTLARMITGVDSPTSGRIVFHTPEGDREGATFKGRALRDYRSHVQMVFKDADSSLNPAMSLGYAIPRPLATTRTSRAQP